MASGENEENRQHEAHLQETIPETYEMYDQAPGVKAPSAAVTVNPEGLAQS